MPENSHRLGEKMIRDVAAKQKRMLRARGERTNYWSAISILGVIGWSVVLPALCGVAIGVWMDRHWPVRIPWTLTLMLAGLAIGCASAWFRIKEDR
jgi:ATP synthase protein I